MLVKDINARKRGRTGELCPVECCTQVTVACRQNLRVTEGDLIHTATARHPIGDGIDFWRGITPHPGVVRFLDRGIQIVIVSVYVWACEYELFD